MKRNIVSDKSHLGLQEDVSVIGEIENDQVSLNRTTKRQIKGRCCSSIFNITGRKIVFCSILLMICFTIGVYLLVHQQQKQKQIQPSFSPSPNLDTTSKDQSNPNPNPNPDPKAKVEVKSALYEEIKLSESALGGTGLNIDVNSFIPYACLSVFVHSPKHLNVILRDCNNTRWELPYEDPFPYPKDSQYLSLEESEFDFILTKDPFRFEIKRKYTQETIYKWTKDFVFTDTYIEYTFETPTNEIYGLGSRPFSLQFHPGRYSLFIIDRTGEVEDGTPGHNAQGHHPVYLMKEKIREVSCQLP